MFVNNKRPRNHDIGVRYEVDGGAREGLIHLVPGVNEVDDQEWAEAKKNKMVLAHIAAGDLVEVKGSSSTPTKESATPGATGGDDAHPVDTRSLSELTVGDASELIAETFDTALLKRWKSEDERVGVNKAIDSQLEKLRLKKEEQDASDEDEEDDDAT